MQRRGADTVGDILGLGLRIEGRAFPLKAKPLTLQANQETVLVVFNIDARRTGIGKGIAGQRDGEAANWGCGARDPIWIGYAVKGGWAEGIIEAGDWRGDDLGGGGGDGGLQRGGLGIVKANLCKGRDLVRDLIVAGHEEVGPLDFRHDRQAKAGIVKTQIAVIARGGRGSIVKTDTIPQIHQAAWIGGGLDVEGPAGAGDQAGADPNG